MSADLLLLVPSRGRPDQAAALYEVVDATKGAATEMTVVVDHDDPTADDYRRNGLPVFTSHAGRGMVGALNEAAAALLPSTQAFAVAFMGDDHRPRTHGWDWAFVDALHRMGSGWVYGDDLHQGPRLPTAVAMTADIPLALGWMAPPCLHHLYVDDAWLALGQQLGRIRYLPHVVIEHMHPDAGKAQKDEGYERVNSGGAYERDANAFSVYQQSRMSGDVSSLRTVLAA